MNDEDARTPFEFLDGSDIQDPLRFPSTMDVLLEYLGTHISRLERLWDTERARVIEQMQSHPEAQRHLAEHLFVIESIFPDVFRGSLLASIYTLCEDGLRSRCYCLRELGGSADEFSESGYLRGYKECVEQLTGIDVQGIDEWHPLTTYGQIRNRVVHHRRRINPGNTDLIGFVEDSSHLKIDDGLIVFDRGACQEFIDIVQRFFESLDEQLPVECRSPERHFGFRP